MLWREVVTLISTTSATNAAGTSITTPTSRDVFANKKSIGRNEFYQAAATGLKPQLMFEIRAIDFSDEQTLGYNGKSYVIIRTYTKNDEIIELTCTGVVNQ